MERDGQQPIIVDFWIPFGLNSPDFKQPVEDDAVAPLMGSTEFLIGGKFKGRVLFLRNKAFDLYLNPDYESSDAITVCPIEVKYTADGHSMAVMENTIPIELNLEIDNMPREESSAIGCELMFGEKKFTGKSRYFIDVFNPSQNGTFDISRWIDPDTGNDKTLFFPPDPEVISKVRLIFFRKPYPPRG